MGCCAPGSRELIEHHVEAVWMSGGSGINVRCEKEDRA